MAEERFSLFGSPTPTEVRQQINQARLAQDMQIANQNPLAAPRLNMMQAGHLFGDSLRAGLGTERPEEAKARKLAAAQQQVAQSGVDFESNPQEYMAASMRALREQGLVNEAFNVMVKMKEMQGMDAGLNESKAKTNLYQNQAKKEKAMAAYYGLGGGKGGAGAEFIQLVSALEGASTQQAKELLLGRLEKLMETDRETASQFTASVLRRQEEEIASGKWTDEMGNPIPSPTTKALIDTLVQLRGLNLEGVLANRMWSGTGDFKNLPLPGEAEDDPLGLR